MDPDHKPAKIINRAGIGLAICKALGLDATRISSLTIKLDHGMPRIEVVLPLFTEDGRALAKTLAEYDLVEKTER
jgi:hypothetical protein